MGLLLFAGALFLLIGYSVVRATCGICVDRGNCDEYENPECLYMDDECTVKTQTLDCKKGGGGVCVPSCACASTTCDDDTCNDGCGGTCDGTKDCCPCHSGDVDKCEGGYMWSCDGCNWDRGTYCTYGCDGTACSAPPYCVDTDCNTNCGLTKEGTTGNTDVWCWKSKDAWKNELPAIPGSYMCVYLNNCVKDECHPSTYTCGGPASCTPPLYPAVDDCGGVNCVSSCLSTSSSGGGCVVTNPAAVTLLSPANGTSFNKVTSVTLDWSDVTAWGEECGLTSPRKYIACVGRSSSSPCDTSTGGVRIEVTSSTMPYSQNIPNTYYWKVKSVNSAGYESAWSETRNFVITNHAPVIGSASPAELKSWGPGTISLTASDADGGTDIKNIYMSFNSCSVDPGDANLSNFERINSNFFGVATTVSTDTFRVANINTGAACTGGISGVSPWAALTGPASNALNTLLISSMSHSVSGNNLTATFGITGNGLAKGTFNYYTMLRDNENLWHTATGTTNIASWKKLTPVCVDGFRSTDTAYVSNWTQWSVCSNVTHTRTRTRTCTQDCLGVDDCAGVTLSETEDCIGRISGHLYDASDCATGCSCGAASPPIGPNTISVTGARSWSLSPNPFSLGVSADGSYTFDAFLGSLGNTFTFDFSQLLASGQIGDVVPKASCPDAAPTLQGCSQFYIGTQPCQPTPARVFDFGFYRKYGGWWQVTGGKVHAQDTIRSIIPASVPTLGDPYPNQRLILEDSSTTPRDGIVTYGNALDLGTNPNMHISESNRQFQQTYQGVRFDYSYFNSKLSGNSSTEWAGGALPTYEDADGNGYMFIEYTGAGALDFSALDVTAGQKILVLTPGDVNVNGYITVAPGGFFGLISGGAITFDSSLGRDNPADNSLTKTFTGWFVGETINFESTGDELTEKQFYGQGSFVAWSGFGMVRDWGVNNNTEAPEQFVYRSDLMINAPELIKFQFKRYSPFNP